MSGSIMPNFVDRGWRVSETGCSGPAAVTLFLDPRWYFKFRIYGSCKSVPESRPQFRSRATRPLEHRAISALETAPGTFGHKSWSGKGQFGVLPPASSGSGSAFKRNFLHKAWGLMAWCGSKKRFAQTANTERRSSDLRKE